MATTMMTWTQSTAALTSTVYESVKNYESHEESRCRTGAPVHLARTKHSTGAGSSSSDQSGSDRDSDAGVQRDQVVVASIQLRLKQQEPQQTQDKEANNIRCPIQGPIGERIWVDPDVTLNSRQSFFVEAFAVISMAFYLGWIHLLAGLAIASFFSKTAMLVFAGLWLSLLIPAKLLWPWFLTNPVWLAWRRYFRFSAIFDAQMELLDTKYVIAEYPHGVFPLSQMVAVSLTKFWPNHPIYCLAADSVFYIPLWRQVMKWIGTVPATAENFRRVLRKGTVGLVPGGIAEMFMVEDDREVIKLLDRKGFVRIAVEQGAPLLPCYHFGNSQLFKWGPKSWEKAARKHRIALGILFGRWGLPLPLPNRVPLMMVVGAPVPTRKTSRQDKEAFNAAVDEAHAALVEAMQQLYDKYKGEYGWADRPLVIV